MSKLISSGQKSAAPAIDAGVLILELLATATHSLTLTEISHLSGIPAASVYRIVKALLAKQMLAIDPRRKKSYTIGAKVFELTASIYHRQRIIPFFYPVAEILKNEIHKSIFLCVTVGSNVVVIAKLDYSFNHSAELFIGQTFSICQSAGGKAILSRMDKAVSDEYLQIEFADKDAVEQQELSDQLARAARLGYALDATLADRQSCIAAPVVNEHNEPIAAICAVVNAPHIDPSQARQYSKNLIQAVRQLSARIL